jgi:MFS family permease
VSKSVVGASAPFGVRERIDALGAAHHPLPRPSVAYYTVFVLILSLTSSQLDIAIVPYLAQHIKADLHLSDTNLSLLLGASFALFYTVVGLPAAWFVDRFSRRWILALGISTWSLGTALCGVAQNFLQLFASRFLVGAGEAVNGPASYSILADLYPRDRMPRAVALMQIGSVAGPGLALLLSTWLLRAFLDIEPIPVPFGVIHGWQLIFVLVGAPGVAVAVLLAVTVPEPARHVIRDQMQPPPAASRLGPWWRDFARALDYMTLHWRVFAPMFGSLLAGSFAIGALQWAPIFYQRTFGWEPARLAGLQSLVQLIVLPIGMVTGVVLAEYLARRKVSDAAIRVLIIARLIALPGLFGVLMPNPWAAFALGALSYFTLGLGAPSQNAALQIVTPAELRGKITALYLLIYSVFGVALAPIVNGLFTDFVLHDESQIRWAIFLPTIVFNPLSLVIIWLGRKPYGREVARLEALEAA